MAGISARRVTGLLAAALVLLAASQAMVALAALSASTDKAVYFPGDTLTLSGQADANALITIKLVDPNGETKVVDQISAGADGSFSWSIRLPADWPTGTYQIVVRNADTGEQQTVTFTLQSGGEITGVVVDENGNPVAGASVYVCDAATGAMVKETATGSDGSFAVQVSAGTYCLRVEKPGYTTASIASITVGTAERVNVGTIEITSLESLIKNLQQALEQLNTTVNEQMAAQLAQLNQSVQQALEQARQEITSMVDAKLATVATKEYVDQQIAQLNQLVANLADQVGTLVAQLDTKAAKTDLEKLAAQLGDLQATLGDLQDQISGLQAQLAGKADQAAINQLAAKLNDISAQISELGDKLSKLQADVGKLGERVDMLEKRVNTLEAATQSIGQLQDAINQLKNSVDSFQQTAAQLQAQVQNAADKAGGASRLAMIGVIAGIIGMIIAVVAAVLVYRKIAG